jgi:hypothetical protein
MKPTKPMKKPQFKFNITMKKYKKVLAVAGIPKPMKRPKLNSVPFSTKPYHGKDKDPRRRECMICLPGQWNRPLQDSYDYGWLIQEADLVNGKPVFTRAFQEPWGYRKFST